MRISKVLRRVIATVVSLLLVVGALGGTALIGNDYRFTETSVEIPTSGGHLTGVLTRPRSGPLQGLVVMIHGDGPVAATQDGLYSPWFEGAADAGFATLSWSKPGIGGSTGDWLAQSMDDRAEEVGVAIDWAVMQGGLNPDRIVLWGASQAGWVLPKVVAARSDVSGTVSVGTAVNWLRQGRFHLQTGLDRDGATPVERERALAESDRVRELVANDASYADYLTAETASPPMSKERWGFVLRNAGSDAEADLRAAADHDIPWLLLAGDHDRNVDVDETARLYGEILGDRLSVRKVDAVHSMARPLVEDNAAVGTVVGIVWPRALLAADVIPAYRDFLRSLPVLAAHP